MEDGLRSWLQVACDGFRMIEFFVWEHCKRSVVKLSMCPVGLDPYSGMKTTENICLGRGRVDGEGG